MSNRPGSHGDHPVFTHMAAFPANRTGLWMAFLPATRPCYVAGRVPGGGSVRSRSRI
jgi:hypothetical protein